MTWADAIPNFLIGLREGLEAGLVVTILLAAVRKIPRSDGRRYSSLPVWLGVLGAVTVAGSFAAVLSFSTSVLSSAAQEAVGGLLSVLAVILVTGMVFWMRQTASSLSSDLRGRMTSAAEVGAGALVVTAFLSVGREGLETTLFLWTAVKASGETVAPLVGAGLGIAGAVLVCWLLYRGAVRINLGVFFSRTAIALIIIAAGVLAYGLGDLQDAGLLPGQSWIAFDLSGTIAADSWWMTIISGATELAPKMTVLQVVAWVAYLAVVIPLFVRAGRRVPAVRPDAGAQPAAVAEEKPGDHPRPIPRIERWIQFIERRVWAVVTGIVVVPALAATAIIVALPADASTQAALTVTESQCAPEFSSAQAGSQTFTVTNNSRKAAEINLDDSAGAIVAEIETLGPATSAEMTATLSEGTYTVKCFLSGQAVSASQPVTVSGDGAASSGSGPIAVKPVTVADLEPAAAQYRAYVAPKLVTLSTQVQTIEADLAAGNLAQARQDWLPAQLTWEEVGAAYDSFGDLGDAIGGLPLGLVGGVSSHDFTGLHRLEYGLWHGQSPAELTPVAGQLATDVAKLQKELPKVTVDPTDLPVRAHEILEDALRDHLSGMSDEGAGAAYPETYADLAGTRVVLDELAPLINARDPKLLPTARRQMDALQKALEATQADDSWQTLETAPLAARQKVNSTIGALLETLSIVPDLLEVPPAR